MEDNKKEGELRAMREKLKEMESWVEDAGERVKVAEAATAEETERRVRAEQAAGLGGAVGSGYSGTGAAGPDGGPGAAEAAGIQGGPGGLVLPGVQILRRPAGAWTRVRRHSPRRHGQRHAAAPAPAATRGQKGTGPSTRFQLFASRIQEFQFPPATNANWFGVGCLGGGGVVLPSD